MARLARFERATYGLEVRCSIHLSYRRRIFQIAYRFMHVHKKNMGVKNYGLIKSRFLTEGMKNR